MKETMSPDTFYNQPVGEVEKNLSTDLNNGLSESEAAARRERYGYNEFQKTRHKSLLVKFLSQFKSFMIIVLLVAAAISGVIGYMHGEGISDAIIILVIVVLNAVIGVAQEAKAEKSLDALEKLSSPHCKVLRGGKTEVIASRELVPGDVVILETGDSVPADLRLAEAVNLKIQESALTGESEASEKNTEALEGEQALGDRHNMAYASTSVTYGRGKGIVTGTGMESEVGKIATMIQSVGETKTPMQERLDKLGKILALAALTICALIFLVGILYGNNLLDMFMTAVSLAVAAIPEGLPAVSTIVLALGVQRLVKKNAIVRKLPSVETLGSTQVICSDKTGTLTQNRMTVVSIYLDGKEQEVKEIALEKYEKEGELIRIGLLVNDTRLDWEEGHWTTTGDPTETALVDLGLRFGLVKTDLEQNMPRVAEVPFDSERKRMSTVHREGDRYFVAAKGGLDEVLACCDRIYDKGQVREITVHDTERIHKANIAMAEKALRVLSFAMNEITALPSDIEPETIEKGLVFVGMVGMIDPPRDEVKVAVATCRKAGIKPVMITGDHKITAMAIAEQLGILAPGDRAVTGLELQKMSDGELMRDIEKISVYARVSPEDKVRIVEAFQRHGKIVAMTGDGVNDAPALKLADIGVAMGITGTDVSKEAADVVLTDDNFATIVTAVEEGRRIYDNILKAINFLLSTNVGEILVLFVAVILNWVSPLLPIHILWINLVTDSLPALALSVDPAAPGVMERQPVDSRKGIMNRPFAIRIVLQGIMIATLSLTAYRIGIQTSVELAQTMTFGVLGLSQITMVFCVRSGIHSAFRVMFNNKYLLGAVVIVLAMMLGVMEIPALFDVFHVIGLNGREWVEVIALALAPLPITEIVKIFLRMRQKRKARQSA